MAKAIDEALARAAKSQEFQQASQSLKTNEVKHSEANTQQAIPSQSADNQNAVGKALDRAAQSKEFQQAKESLKQNEVSQGQSVDKATPQSLPSNSPANPSGLENKQVDAQTKNNIESVQQSQGNNYQNAVDRALSRPTKDASVSNENVQDKQKGMER